MTKDYLNQEIGKLKASLEAHESQVQDLQQDLKIAEKKLEDCDKPKLTEKQFAKVQLAIEKAVDDYSFCDESQYEYDIHLYDRTIELEHIEFNERGTLTDEIYASVEDCFGEADESDDDDESPSE